MLPASGRFNLAYTLYTGPIATFSKARHNTRGALFGAILISFAMVSWGQNAPASEAQATPSLGNSLQRARTDNTQLHILYVHGMAASGPGDSASLDLRKSICKFLHDCTTTAGEFDGTEYADENHFAEHGP